MTEAIYDAGFNSSGRFYANSTEVLGMNLKSYRAAGDSLRFRRLLARCDPRRRKRKRRLRDPATPEGAPPAELRQRFLRAKLIKADAAFSKTVAKAIRLIEARVSGVDLPLDVRGTAFQHHVWKVPAIPAGSTSTYAEVARRIGKPKAVRAVAALLARQTHASRDPMRWRCRSRPRGLASYCCWGS